MGIQFRLGPGDHKPVEDFLSRDHAGTTAITLDTNATRHQHDAAAAAVDAVSKVQYATKSSVNLVHQARWHLPNSVGEVSLVERDNRRDVDDRVTWQSRCGRGQEHVAGHCRQRRIGRDHRCDHSGKATCVVRI